MLVGHCIVDSYTEDKTLWIDIVVAEHRGTNIGIMLWKDEDKDEGQNNNTTPFLISVVECRPKEWSLMEHVF